MCISKLKAIMQSFIGAAIMDQGEGFPLIPGRVPAAPIGLLNSEPPPEVA